jgi:hypothetical protein
MSVTRGSFTLLDTAILVVATAALLAEIGHGPESMGMLWIWALHSVTAAVLSAPVIFFGRGRVHWGPLDLLTFLLPFAVWVALIDASSAGKSLSNLVEPIVFSFAIPIAALVRVMMGPRALERAWSIGLVTLLCLTAVCVYWWTPGLPE